MNCSLSRSKCCCSFATSSKELQKQIIKSTKANKIKTHLRQPFIKKGVTQRKTANCKRAVLSSKPHPHNSHVLALHASKNQPLTQTLSLIRRSLSLSLFFFTIMDHLRSVLLISLINVLLWSGCSSTVSVLRSHLRDQPLIVDYVHPDAVVTVDFSNSYNQTGLALMTHFMLC